MTTDPQDTLGEHEIEWDLRRKVEGRHAMFQIKPSMEAANALARALEVWRMNDVRTQTE